jgi:hypothetical protein
MVCSTEVSAEMQYGAQQVRRDRTVTRSVGRRGSRLVQEAARAEQGGRRKAGGIIAAPANGNDEALLFGGGVRGNPGSSQSQRRHGHSGMLALEGAIETAWPFWRQQQSALTGPGGQQHRRFESVTKFDDTDSTAGGVTGRRLSAAIPHPHARAGANNPSTVETATTSENSGRNLRVDGIVSYYSPRLPVVNRRVCPFDFGTYPSSLLLGFDVRKNCRQRRTRLMTSIAIPCASVFSASNWLDAPDRFTTKTQRSYDGHRAVTFLCAFRVSRVTFEIPRKR